MPVTPGLFDSMKGKRILITGAGTGIGSAMARLFGSLGAHLGLHYHSSGDAVTALMEEINQGPGRADSLRADFHDTPTLTAMLERFVAIFGGIDGLVNNAGGIYDYVPFSELSLEAWEKTYTLNVTAPFFLTRDVFERMRQAGTGGRIITISTVSARYGGSENNVHYSSSKAALDSLTTSFSRFGAPHNILVNSIRCGLVDSGMTGKMPGYSEERYRKRLALVPLGRAGTPDEVARTALHLLSDGGSFITGQWLEVSGGD